MALKIAMGLPLLVTTSSRCCANWSQSADVRPRKSLTVTNFMVLPLEPLLCP